MFIVGLFNRKRRRFESSYFLSLVARILSYLLSSPHKHALCRHDPKLEFCELIIPTVDSVRYTYLLNLLIAGDKHVLMTGAYGAHSSRENNVNQQQVILIACIIKPKDRLTRAHAFVM